MRLYGTRRRGSITGLAASVADVVELKRLQTSGGFADKTLVYVEETNTLYAYDRQSSATESDPDVIAPNGGVGRWNLVAGGGATGDGGGGATGVHVHNKYADVSTVVGPNQAILSYEEYEVPEDIDIELLDNSDIVIL
jgi:hypothetical protein